MPACGRYLLGRHPQGIQPWSNSPGPYGPNCQAELKSHDTQETSVLSSQPHRQWQHCREPFQLAVVETSNNRKGRSARSHSTEILACDDGHAEEEELLDSRSLESAREAEIEEGEDSLRIWLSFSIFHLRGPGRSAHPFRLPYLLLLLRENFRKENGAGK